MMRPESSRRRRATPLLAAAAGIGALPCAATAAVGGWGAYRVYHPRRQDDRRSPGTDGLAMRAMDVASSLDGVRLAGWVVPASGPGTVVVCHGMGRDRGAVVPHIRMLHAAGYHVVAYDLRNHGDSGDDRAYGHMADRFVSDLRDVIEHVRGDAELGRGGTAILAFSFSTWPAIHILRDGSVPIDAVVCDSGPTADLGPPLRRAFDLKRRTLGPVLRHQPLYGMCRLAFQLFSRHMLAVREWPPDLDGIRTRLMFISGERDAVILPAEVTALADNYPDATQWVCPNARHTGALRADRDEYGKRVTAFLDEAFSAHDAWGQGQR